MFSYAPPTSRTSSFVLLRTLFLAACLFASAAHADEYSDVNRLIRAGQLSEALVKAEQYLANKPRDPQMRFIKGVIQTEAGKPTDAIATFTKITEDYPELPEPYNNLAVLYAGQSQYDKARTSLEMAIRTNPSYATAHENLGDVYAKLASQAYSKALQLDSSNSGVQPKLALIRTLFAPEAKGQKPTQQAVVTAQAPAAAEPSTATATPVSTSALAVTTTPGTTSDKEVEDAVQTWASAWSSKDMNAYLAAYAPDFKPAQKQSRKNWETSRRDRIMGKSRISVKLSGLTVLVNGSKASARFKQDYSADSLHVVSQKTLDLVRVGDRWLIAKESSGD